MGIFRGRKTRTDGGAVISDRNASKSDLDALREFAESRKGVEGYIEPKTSVTQTTLLLVAADGESLRRRVASPQAAADFARKKLGIPVYDANLVGIPSRKRDYDLRKAKGTRPRRRPRPLPPRSRPQGARRDHDSRVDRWRRSAADQPVIRRADGRLSQGAQAGPSRPSRRRRVRSGTRSRTLLAPSVSLTRLNDRFLGRPPRPTGASCERRHTWLSASTPSTNTSRRSPQRCRSSLRTSDRRSRRVPGSGETIRYQMPCATLGDRYLIHYAGWKKHIGLYPVPVAGPISSPRSRRCGPTRTPSSSCTTSRCHTTAREDRAVHRRRALGYLLDMSSASLTIVRTPVPVPPAGV